MTQKIDNSKFVPASVLFYDASIKLCDFQGLVFFIITWYQWVSDAETSANWICISFKIRWHAFAWWCWQVSVKQRNVLWQNVKSSCTGPQLQKTRGPGTTALMFDVWCLYRKKNTKSKQTTPPPKKKNKKLHVFTKSSEVSILWSKLCMLSVTHKLFFWVLLNSEY